ncbi:PREDICTED: uncharacterized protein LOC108759090 [Trachymyrmex cornetzi]|uniref:uncharacterized protein LOC108759090 n=1 Tax=Trachymyrmex cornetzi TaxID=471704 RepID=UPI00084F112C|nr:PREDICTED: uncharacterized protein LOC108759090 [Trachymyrmex cornetzi]
MAEGDFSVAIVSEPYTIPEGHPHWHSNEMETVAITWRQAQEAIPCTPYERGEHFTSIRWGDMLIVGVYLPPSLSIPQCEEALEELERWAIRHMDRPMIIGGDHNAKSPMWNSRSTNPRGILVVEWASAMGTCCLNKGHKSTCIRINGESIVDITFANPIAARRVINWTVSKRESKGDHRYIELSMSPTGQQLHRRKLPRAQRWATKKLNEDVFLAAIMAGTWTRREKEVENTEVQAKSLQKAMVEACDASMPRSIPRPRRAMPWWSEELATLRQELTRARRQLRRIRRRAAHLSEAEKQLYLLNFRLARDSFGKALRRAKAKAWEDFVQSLNEDPWGRPYKLVLGKLRRWTPPFTESLEEGTLNECSPDCSHHP